MTRAQRIAMFAAIAVTAILVILILVAFFTFLSDPLADLTPGSIPSD